MKKNSSILKAVLAAQVRISYENLKKLISIVINFADDEVIVNLVRSKPIPVKLHGVCQNKPTNDDPEDFGFLISFSDGRYKVVPRREAHKLCAQLVIDYYETCILFSDELEDFGFTKDEDNDNSNSEPCSTSAANKSSVTADEGFEETGKVSSSTDKDPLDSGLMLPKTESMEVEPSVTQSVLDDMHSEDCLIGSSGI